MTSSIWQTQLPLILVLLLILSEGALDKASSTGRDVELLVNGNAKPTVYTSMDTASVITALNYL